MSEEEETTGQTERMVGRRFYVERLIGRGASSRVMAARCRRTNRPVALKLLTRPHEDDVGGRRFTREAHAAAAIDHRHVCRFYEAGVLDDGTRYLAMELLEGETLATRLKDGPLDVATAVAITLQVLSGLIAVHDRGIVHRDVKPSNVMLVGPRGAPPEAKLIDFGLVKLVTPSGDDWPEDDVETITRKGVIPGTPWYLAPEQVAQSHPIGPRVDVWATGLLFYEVLTGRRAYEGSDLKELFGRIVRETPTPVRELRPDVPKTVAKVLAKAIARSPSERYQNAKELRDDLVRAWSIHRVRIIKCVPPSSGRR